MSKDKNTEKKQLIYGTLDKNKKGFGFIKMDEGDDIFVAAKNMGGAMNGDEIAAEILPVQRNGHSSEAVVVKIMKRSYSEVIGKLSKDRNFGFVVPLDKSNCDDIFISKSNIGKAEDGDMVVARITKYPKADKNAEGKIKEIIAKNGDQDADVLSLVRQYGLRDDFPHKVTAEADVVSEIAITEEEIGRRKDFRDQFTVTIDGPDSKDFDDAVSLRMLDNGNYYLSVHIADVSHYVGEDTYLDKEALKRGNSIYLINKVIPMLPKVLSNGICSLNPNEDRLTLSCCMEIDHQGDVVEYDICESVINSDERLVYNDVSDLLENNDIEQKNKYIKIYPMLLEMRDVSLILREKRNKLGSLDFDFDEAKIQVDENEEPVSIDIVPRRIANRMIEEFMLAANRTVAEHYFWIDCPFVYRVHEKPEAEKMFELKKFLGGFNINLGTDSEAVKPKALSRVLQNVAGTPSENVINRVMIRTMQKAVYMPECLGHYALAFRYYCHFTSPIRRYPDLLIHRIIKEQLNLSNFKQRYPHYKEVVKLASESSSLTEKTAQELEREVTKNMKVKFMENKVGEQYSGIISGMMKSGIYVELENTIEGFIRYDSMDDYYVLDEENYKIIGEASHKVLAMGDRVRVEVDEVNVTDKYIDFKLLDE